MQVRPILNGVLLTSQGVEAQARVFTERETELMAQMPEKVRPDMSKFLLCPMPGLVVVAGRERGPGGRGGRRALRGRGDEDGERAQGRARRKVSKILAKPGDSLNVDAVILEFA